MLDYQSCQKSYRNCSLTQDTHSFILSEVSFLCNISFGFPCILASERNYQLIFKSSNFRHAINSTYICKVHHKKRFNFKRFQAILWEATRHLTIVNEWRRRFFVSSISYVGTIARFGMWKMVHYLCFKIKKQSLDKILINNCEPP